MITDQRTDHRVSFFLAADVYRQPNGEKFGRAVVRDLSFSGMRIETLEPLNQGETVWVDFDVVGRFTFARVPLLVNRVYRNTGSYLAGLSFQKGFDRRRIRHALAYAIESSI